MIARSAALRKPTDALDRGPDLAVYVVGDSYRVGSGDVLIDVPDVGDRVVGKEDGDFTLLHADDGVPL
jgi:hypothetical protein